MDINNYKKKIFQIKSEDEFNHFALQLFHYQYSNNKTYQKYVDILEYQPKNINQYAEIPFLPIEFFRTKKIISNNLNHETFFLSSGTTNFEKSKHYIVDKNIYKKSILSSFNLFLKTGKELAILCLVPNFKNSPQSSLAFMCQELIESSKNRKSGFYLNKLEELNEIILNLEQKKQNYIVFGLSFEILNFAKQYKIDLKHGIIIETGGTKKKQLHITQKELHNRLKLSFNTKKIYSEYGMAELLSQSYFKDKACFESPPWKKILIRDKTNPLKILTDTKRGCVNIIDLANIYSCGFIATNDLGYLTKHGFNIIGRNQNATERGCNLLI